MTGKDSSDSSGLFSRLANEDYCYLTTAGRVSGRPHEIEIWFGIHNNTLYLLSGGDERSDWVKNLTRDPKVTVRLAKHTFNGMARIVKNEKEELMARHMLAEKYQGWRKGKPLSEWAREALPVAVDLEVPDTQG